MIDFRPLSPAHQRLHRVERRATAIENGGHLRRNGQLDAVPFTALVALRYRARLDEALARAWRPAALGGVLAAGAYAMVIWAMTRAPMAQVSALRETSVIMAALIGTRLLREPFGTRRGGAVNRAASGAVLLQVSRAV